MLDKLQKIRDLCKEITSENEGIHNIDHWKDERTNVLFNARLLDDFIEMTAGINVTVVYSNPGVYQLRAIKGDFVFVTYLNKYQFNQYEEAAAVTATKERT